MRYTFSVILLIWGLFSGCTHQLSHSGNPLFPGWYADPEGIIYGDRYWIFPTYSAPYGEQVFMDAFSSKDLRNWEKHPRIIDTGAVSWAEKAMWAPSVIERNGKYFLFFGANDIQSDEETGGIGIAVADKPEGPYRDYLGKPLIDKFHNGAQPIDQFVFEDSDGKLYLIYGGWRHCNIVKLRDDLKGIEQMADGTVFREITPEDYVEGPFMFIRNDKYYFMWSEGGWTGPDYSVAYAISDSLFGPYERIGRIIQQDTSIATGAGHHSVIRIPGTDEYYFVYHRRPAGQTDRNSREVCIEKMEFDKDGFIKPVIITREGVPARRIN